MYGMKEGSERAFGKGYNVLPIFKDRLNAKTLITTPNSDVIFRRLVEVTAGEDRWRPYHRDSFSADDRLRHTAVLGPQRPQLPGMLIRDAIGSATSG
jgi:hypothetical protein